MTDESVTITALAFDPETREWTKPVTYHARNRMEAIRWRQFNNEWMTQFRIDGERW